MSSTTSTREGPTGVAFMPAVAPFASTAKPCFAPPTAGRFAGPSVGMARLGGSSAPPDRRLDAGLLEEDPQGPSRFASTSPPALDGSW